MSIPSVGVFPNFNIHNLYFVVNHLEKVYVIQVRLVTEKCLGLGDSALPIRIRSLQPPSYYIGAYYIPLFTEAGSTVCNQFMKLLFKARNRHNSTSIFNHLSIETHNRCNNNCSFCPASRHSDKRPPMRMSTIDFSRISDQLHDIDYAGKVGLSNNNEPLLDSRLPSFVSEIKDKVPRASVSIWTNGILLDLTRLRELHSNGFGLGDKLVIDDYSLDRKLTPHIVELMEEIKGTDLEKDLSITVWIRDKNVVLTNRAGRAPNKKGFNPDSFRGDLILRRWCPQPFFRFNINPAGKAHICCYDAYYDHVVGDITKESILDIWYGDELSLIRSELNRNGRRNIFPCNVCDSTI